MTTPMALDDREEWLEEALNKIRAYALSGLPFSSDDLRKCIREPVHPNLWGNVFSQASQMRIIRYVKHQKSTTPSRRHSAVAVWERSERYK